MACPAQTAIAEQAVQGSVTVAKRFQLADRVIFGNFASTVLLAAARNDDSVQVVVKVMMKENLGSEQELKSAKEEVEVHAGLPPHPHVLRLLAAEETPEAFLLVTPFLPHGDLWSLMQYGQTYTERQVRNCAGQMLSALRHLHDVCGLIHADIKPHNFLLDRQQGRFNVQLCDFGFTECPGPGGVVNFYVVRGTSGWFSPEMLRHRDYSFPMDLFGVGLIVFRMLGGYAPFDPPSRFQTSVEYPDQCWCHVSEPCRHLVSKLLRVEPSERGTAAEALEHLWVSGPEPAPPTEEQLAALMAYGPPPDASVEFWPACGAPSAMDCECDNRTDLATTAPRSSCGSLDSDESETEFDDRMSVASA